MTPRELADRLAPANSWAESDVSSPSADRTVSASDVAALSTASLLAALLVAFAITLPVIVCAALTDTPYPLP